MFSTTLVSFSTLFLPHTILAAVISPRASTPQVALTYTLPFPNSDSNSAPLKVPGESPAYYCSAPADDIFQIRDLDFLPKNPRIGFYLTIRFIGHFVSATGDVPWLNVTGSIDGREELEPFYYAPLCDIDVFQDVSVPRPGGEHRTGEHRSCPPAIHEGYGVIWTPPIPLQPMMFPEGRYSLRAEATTQDGRSIFCVEGSFDITK